MLHQATQNNCQKLTDSLTFCLSPSLCLSVCVCVYAEEFAAVSAYGNSLQIHLTTHASVCVCVSPCVCVWGVLL